MSIQQSSRILAGYLPLTNSSNKIAQKPIVQVTTNDNKEYYQKSTLDKAGIIGLILGAVWLYSCSLSLNKPILKRMFSDFIQKFK